MNSLSGSRLQNTNLAPATVWLLESLAESKGRQSLFEKQSPQILRALGEMALIESAESSNRIEGVTVHRERLRPLVSGKSRPRDRSEEEIVGYRKALSWIHTSFGKIEIGPSTFRRLHAIARGESAPDAGKWKSRPNEIVEVFPDGRRVVRFGPVEPERVATAAEELCSGYANLIEVTEFPRLVAAAAFVFDFLCIHPFRDGNGRVSRLLTLLVLYKLGYHVGRYISLERIVEENKERYYEVLRESSTGWHHGTHDLSPWTNYFLFILHRAYREFEERSGRDRPPRGSKADLVAYALEHVQNPFGIAQIERACPSVSREMIRLVMRRWRTSGRLRLLGRGRDAKWERV